MKADGQPRFLSKEFHLHFFPALLRRRLHPVKREGTTFVYWDGFIVLAFCAILAMTGLSYVLPHSPVFGWIVGGLGAAGILALFFSSVYSNWGNRPSYDDFLAGFFFFFTTLGASAGIFIGALNHSFILGLGGTFGGLLIGYLLGILAGLVLQYLGWISVWLNHLAVPAIIGLIVVDVVLIFGGLLG